MRSICPIVCAVAVMLCVPAHATVPGAISFQGRLTDVNAVPTPGEFPMTFRLWDDSTGGNALVTEVLPSVKVDDDGLYSVEVAVPDSTPFDDQLWLGVEVESSSEMTPRYKLTGSPYAFLAMNSRKLDGRESGNLAGNIAINDGILCEDLNADMVDGMDSDEFITGGGTVGAIPKFLGPRGLSDSPISVAVDTVILTGGLRVTDKVSIGRGCTNAGTNAFAVGYNCSATGNYAVVAGGDSNVAGNTRASVGGGHRNTATGTSTSIAGGYRNIASDTFATVAGGYTNEATKRASTVGGGYGNHASDRFATVAGGNDNRASGNTSSVGGGYWNTAGGSYSFVGGGYTNAAKGSYSAILCGIADTIITGADYSYLFGIKSKLTQDSTFMVDMPHIRFGNEATGYEFPISDGVAGQYLVTDGSGHLSWQSPALPLASEHEMRLLVSSLKAQQAEIDSLKMEVQRIKMGR